MSSIWNSSPLNDVRVIVFVLVAGIVVLGIVCILFPFRPDRYQRLGYARWQRSSSRIAEVIVMWPIGALELCTGGWFAYELGDMSTRPFFWPPVLAAQMMAVLCATIALTHAWLRRLSPDERAEFAKSSVVGTVKIAYTTQDTKLGVTGASVEHVDFAGDGLTAVEQKWAGDDAPMTPTGRMYLGGEWRPKPQGYSRALGQDDGGVLLLGASLMFVGADGTKGSKFDAPNAGFPIAVLNDAVVYSVDEDDDGESDSDPRLLSEGIFATDFEGNVIWRAATDNDERLRHSVFSFYGASRTDHDTALVVVYGSFTWADDSVALFEVDPKHRQLTRLPFPRQAHGTQSVVEVGDGWLCALGSYADGDQKHHLRCWRRDGSGTLLVQNVPILEGWVDWRIQGGRGQFVTWAGRIVRTITPGIVIPPDSSRCT